MRNPIQIHLLSTLLLIVTLAGCDLCFEKEHRPVDREYFLMVADSSTTRILDYELRKDVELENHDLRGFFQSKLLISYRDNDYHKVIPLSNDAPAVTQHIGALIKQYRDLAPSNDFKLFLYDLHERDSYNGFFKNVPFRHNFTASSIHQINSANWSLDSRTWNFGTTRPAADTLIETQLMAGFYSSQNKPVVVLRDLFYHLSTDSLKSFVYTTKVKTRVRVEDVSGTDPVRLFTFFPEVRGTVSVFDRFMILHDAKKGFTFNKTPQFLAEDAKFYCCEGRIYAEDGSYIFDQPQRKFFATSTPNTTGITLAEELGTIKDVSMNNGFFSVLFQDNRIGLFKASTPHSTFLAPERFTNLIETAYSPSTPESEIAFQNIWTGSDGKVYLQVVRSLYTQADLTPCE